jgi:hypothetical protein
VEQPARKARRTKATAPDDIANEAITTGITSAETEPSAPPPPVTEPPSPAAEEPPPAARPPVAEQVSNLAENPRSARREADRLVERFGPYPDAFAALIGHLVIVAERTGIEWRRQA